MWSRSFMVTTTSRASISFTNYGSKVGPEVDIESAAKSTNLVKSALQHSVLDATPREDCSLDGKQIPLILVNRLGPLHMQKELVDGCEGISRTAAGEGFNSELNSRIEKRQQEIRVLGNDTKRALKDKDEETWR